MSNSNRARVAYYTRAAHDSDNTREQLARQAERARAQIQARSDWILTETATDLGSGLHVKLSLRQLLDQAREGGFDLLLIKRLSDLGRSLDALTHTLAELHVAGVDLRTVNGERIDTATGHLITVLLLTVDE
jgi:DNA invertase Pin-like site-specific DNA recombinase